MSEPIHFRRIRPRIKVETAYTPEEIHQKIRAKLRSGTSGCSGQSTRGFATLYPPEEEQHYWSPQLTLTIEATENGSLVRGLYGPKPSVWTMFVFFYSVIGFAALMVTMIGLSFWSLNKPSGIFWLVPALILLFLSLYLVAYFGQKLGHQQMGALHRFMEDCLDEEIEAT